LVESIIFLVLSIIIFDESEVTVFTLSVFTIVVESVVVVEEPDPQAAKELMAKMVNIFFILMSLKLNTCFFER
jgi:hypothetical protein